LPVITPAPSSKIAVATPAAGKLRQPKGKTTKSKRPESAVVDRWTPPPTVAPSALAGDRDHWFANIRAVQEDCGIASDSVPMHFGGGFASKFQLMAGKAMKIFRRGRSVRLVGHLGGYSAIGPCKEMLGWDLYKESSFTCFFQSERPCKKDQQGKGAGSAAAELLKGSGAKDEMALFQAIEAYFFRVNEATSSDFHHRELSSGVSDVPGPGRILIGVHARRGDKVHDSYNRYYTAREYADAIMQGTGALQLAPSAAHRCTVYVASDSAAVIGELKSIMEGTVAKGCAWLADRSTCRR